MRDIEMPIFVAGHNGMVGSALVRELLRKGYVTVLHRPRSELNLLDQNSVIEFMKEQRPSYVFIAAAKVGGIQANNIYRAQFIYENLTIQNNLIHAAYLSGVQRLMFLGSSCIYPKLAPQPIKEDYLLTGLLEPTNEPYAIAKIAGIKMCEAYNAQYGRKYVSVMPTNLYGPNDSYDLNNSHVLPALIRKFHLAKLAHAGDVAGIASDEGRYGAIPADILQSLGLVRDASGALVKAGEPGPVLLWGTGTPRREFLYVDDLAAACVHLMETGYDGPLVNIGVGDDVTIRELSEVAKAAVGYSGEVVFDSTKPDGTPRKLLDVGRLKSLGFEAKMSLDNGVRLAYADYIAGRRT